MLLIILIALLIFIILVGFTNRHNEYTENQENPEKIVFRESVSSNENIQNSFSPSLNYNTYTKNDKVIENENYYFEGKLNNKILTYNELKFFRKLKVITDKYNMLLFPKIRMADIIQTNDYSNFNKIKSKHIDFTICNEKTEPILFIELDDTTHNLNKVKENDKKKDYIMRTLFKKIIRVKLYEIDKELVHIENLLNKEYNITKSNNKN